MIQRTRRRRRRRQALVTRLAGVTAGLFALVGVLGALVVVGVVNHYAGNLPSVDALRAGGLAQVTRIYDRNGVEIEPLYLQNRTVVPLARISPLLRKATIATEDRTFYEHQGVDYRRLLIALAFDLTHRQAAQGGSTITEQVIKNMVLDPVEAQEKTASRKLRELMLAEEMERRYNKDQILELYLNSILYGNGAFGAEAAAETYFGVHASELDLAQASFLAGLPQYPTGYDPFGGPTQQAAAKERWRDVLQGMVETRIITPAQMQAAMDTDAWSRMQAHHKATAGGRDPRTAHFVDWVRRYLLDRYGAKLVYQGGLQVVTTLDLATQVLADNKVKAAVQLYESRGVNTGALLALNPLDGEVLAMVGSAGYDNAEIRGQINLTGVDGLGLRGVGSSFKVYTYGAALEAGLATAATRVNDQEDMIGTPPHKFSDWDGKKEGWITLRRAIQESRNLPALWTYKLDGGVRVVNFARKLGIGTPFENPDALATTLGPNPMSLAEHLSAYAAFDNGGFLVSPHPVLRVSDSGGRVLEQLDTRPSSVRVISPQLAYLMTDLLHGPPSRALGMGRLPVAGKSGTVEAWTGSTWLGYTPEIAVAGYLAHIDSGPDCRSGYAYLATSFPASGWQCPMNVVWGEHVGLSLWKPFLEGYYANRPWPAAWTAPAGIVKRSVCKLDGNLATDRTPAGESYDEIFIKGVGEPVASCGSNPPPGATPYPSPSPSPGPSPSPRASPRPTPSN
ncbi:MAG TPA: transglycosylase domain-containing protein [Candidatus Acidoferrales bacterium]|nr:transglycosylase domain-containing protein [Candidatus Acidoferrales bacterium]